ncbi:DNA-deoxyinosine glycosylase [Mycobacterium gordonae]|uniref:DNA-deoxyinosine glycosylase n=1 Tax=Mycobacterium gordonae TaxID=1778 RepID=A0A0Q2LYB8_MYCGO|nr:MULTISPECIES: DNA-deoxyinosine glycosylase [Mycobacterium]KQH80857.1 DNA-deoxyinosine glycosylase [Mycobacterium gordonae]MDP7726802.1 DNA-deoxyinosine glycosylase [Mycobacterium sp. TY813]
MTEPLLDGLAPVIDGRAEVLVLGSFPSVRSLAEGQYYANPRNAFWPIIAELFGFDCAARYSERLAALQSHRVALWDVLRSCRRTGSADAAIDPKTLVLNDFDWLFAAYPGIARVYLNGAAAARLFERTVGCPAAVTCHRLPSTSPAHAIPRAAKLAAWATLIDGGS